MKGSSSSRKESVGPPMCQQRLPALAPARTTPDSQHSRNICGKPCAVQTAIRLTTLPPSTRMTCWASRCSRTPVTFGCGKSLRALNSTSSRSANRFDWNSIASRDARRGGQIGRPNPWLGNAARALSRGRPHARAALGRRFFEHLEAIGVAESSRCRESREFPSGGGKLAQPQAPAIDVGGSPDEQRTARSPSWP